MQIDGFLGHVWWVAAIIIGLLSGVLSVFREFQAMYFPTSVAPRKALWAWVRIAFILCALVLWLDEHDKVQQLLNKKPQDFQLNLPADLITLLKRQLTIDPSNGNNKIASDRTNPPGQLKKDRKPPGSSSNQPTKPAATDSPTLPIQTLTLSQKEAPSTNPDLPFALEVVVQTSTDISPVSLLISCTDEVDAVKPRFGGVATDVRMGYITGHKELVLLKFSSPSLRPDRPLVVVMESKSRVKALGVKSFDF